MHIIEDYRITSKATNGFCLEKIRMLEENNVVFKEQLEDLQKENEILKAEVDYQPGGEGMKEAQDHYIGLI